MIYKNWQNFSAATFLTVIILAALVLGGCKTQEAAQQDTSEVPKERVEPSAHDLDIPETPRESRAVWVATVANIDWPSEPGLPVDKQKKELLDILNRAAAMNMNAVIFQVRPATDAMYDSQYEPWSTFLTGTMGKAPVPYYDPLEFAVKEAHKRGLELHAWFNPYRARHPSDESEVAPNHISQTNPDMVLDFGNYQWLDPGLEEVRNHSKRVIMDVVKRYDVDGVHLDDYFYPYPSYGGGAEFPDSLSWQQALAEDSSLSRDDWRRSNVDRLIRDVYEEIKAEDPQVKFGISPFGTWRPGYPAGTGGFDAYEQLYADARLWLREGWVDYFTPQIYNRIDRVIRPFPVMLQWWIEQNEYDRHMWPGLYTSRSSGENGWPTEEITGQVYIARGHPGVTGSVHFSMRSLLDNWNNLVSDITAGVYALPALMPSSAWLNDRRPDRPSASMNLYSDKMLMEIGPVDEDIRWWVLWSQTDGNWEMDVIPGSQHKIAFEGVEASIWPDKVAVSAVDKYGNESLPEVLTAETDQLKNENNHMTKPEIVDRDEWGPGPVGAQANAVRRNLAEGDTLHFRDFTIVHNKMISGIDSTQIDSIAAAKSDSLNVGDMKVNVAPDTAHLSLYRYSVAEDLKIPEGKSFNWHGYHIGLLAVNTDEQMLGGGLTELEIGTVSSLSVSRAAAKETGGASQRLRIPHKITDITLHHSGSAKPLTEDEDPVERLQNLYEWGRESRNWWDVPYHYLIGLDGTIYEGRDTRYAGETNTSYDPRGHLLITVMGNYDKQKPTDAQVQAISDLMAWSADKYDLTRDDISGHFELADTGCPGVHLREIFEQGTFHEAVEGRPKEATIPAE